MTDTRAESVWPDPIRTAVISSKRVSLPVELAQAALGGVITGLGTFTGALTVTSATDVNALKAAAIGAGFTFLTFFTNALRNWYSQQS